MSVGMYDVTAMTRPTGIAASAAQTNGVERAVAGAAAAVAFPASKPGWRATSKPAKATRTASKAKPVDQSCACSLRVRNGSITNGYAIRAANEPRLEAA